MSKPLDLEISANDTPSHTKPSRLLRLKHWFKRAAGWGRRTGLKAKNHFDRVAIPAKDLAHKVHANKAGRMALNAAFMAAVGLAASQAGIENAVAITTIASTLKTAMKVRSDSLAQGHTHHFRFLKHNKWRYTKDLAKNWAFSTAGALAGTWLQSIDFSFIGDAVPNTASGIGDAVPDIPDTASPDMPDTAFDSPGSDAELTPDTPDTQAMQADAGTDLIIPEAPLERLQMLVNMHPEWLEDDTIQAALRGEKWAIRDAGLAIFNEGWHGSPLPDIDAPFDLKTLGADMVQSIAEQGDTNAQANFAFMQRWGLGTQQNIRAALDMVKQLGKPWAGASMQEILALG